jgi:hemoglobin
MSLRVTSCLVLCSALGCATPDSQAPATPASPAAADPPAASTGGAAKSLYERLGGKAAIEAVIDAFIGNLAKDKRIAYRFALTDLKDLRNKLVDQVCAATGGPCTYKGADMKTAHKGMRVTSAEFTALVEDLIAALDQYKVPAQEKGELLSALGGMQGDIVEE